MTAPVWHYRVRVHEHDIELVNSKDRSLGTVKHAAEVELRAIEFVRILARDLNIEVGQGSYHRVGDEVDAMNLLIVIDEHERAHPLIAAVQVLGLKLILRAAPPPPVTPPPPVPPAPTILFGFVNGERLELHPEANDEKSLLVRFEQGSAIFRVTYDRDARDGSRERAGDLSGWSPAIAEKACLSRRGHSPSAVRLTEAGGTATLHLRYPAGPATAVMLTRAESSFTRMSK